MSKVLPGVTRARVVTEIASELVARRPGHVKVLLRQPSERDWSLVLFGSSTVQSLHDVGSGAAQLALVNPSAALTIAYRGIAPFNRPLPLRAIAVIPSRDQLMFAVRPETGLNTLEEIAERRMPLRIYTRGTKDHCIHLILDHVMASAGFSADALQSWGGRVMREGGLPTPDSEKFRAAISGEVDAIFDEGVEEWLTPALEGGLKILPLAPSTIARLQGMGYRPAVIRQRDYPKLPCDITTIDFSGWPIFVNASVDDALVEDVCEALVARKHLIPWQGEGALPVERMCLNGEGTPVDIPLHAAAERFWRRMGYLR